MAKSPNGARGAKENKTPQDSLRQPLQDRGHRQERFNRGGEANRPDVSSSWLRFSWRYCLLAVLAVVLALLVSQDLFDSPPAYQVHQLLKQDLRASVTFTVSDGERMQEQMEEVRERAPQIYLYQAEVGKLLTQKIRRLLEKAEELRLQEGLTVMEKGRRLSEWARSFQNVDLPAPYAEGLIRPRNPALFEQTLPQMAQQFYAHFGVVEDLQRYQVFYENARIRFEQNPPFSDDPRFVTDSAGFEEFLKAHKGFFIPLQSEMSPEDQVLAKAVVQRYLQPNLIYDNTASAEALNRKLQAIEENPPRKTYEKGTVLLEKGQRISRQDLDLIEAMQTRFRQTRWHRFLGTLLYVGLLCGLVFYYLRSFRKDLVFTTNNLLLVALPLLLSVAIGRIALEVALSPTAAGYAFPAAIIGMLAVILLDPRTAILLVTVGSLIFAVATGLDFKIFLTSLIGGYTAVTVLTHAQERKDFLKAGLVVGMVNAIVILLINFIDDPASLPHRFLFWGLANGLLCGALSMAALSLFEMLFDQVTDIRLLELTGLDHPLLKRLEEKSPGSYQHCLNVCKLAEAAAKAIGANYLLVRAGAYYHDIGKTLKPSYFSENQVSLEEKALHSRLSPYMSAMIIKNHVKAGVELAQQYKLPQKVISFIPQHHGTTIISFFYHQALKRFENSQSTDPVREEDFRYPGPKPQFIESAIVMLADSVEATVTSRFTSLSVNEDALMQCVQKSITDKFNDGQFDECDLTLKELHQIRQVFVKTLLGRFHHRVAYPTQPGLSGPSAPTQKKDRMDREENPVQKMKNKAAQTARA